MFQMKEQHKISEKNDLNDMMISNQPGKKNRLNCHKNVNLTQENNG